MPADRSFADGVGDELVSRYEQLRTTLIATLAARLRRSLAGQDRPRSIAQGLLARLERTLDEQARRAIEAAHERGRAAADAELRQLRREARPPSPVDVAGRVLDLARTLRSTHPRVLSWAEQAYRLTVLAASQAQGGTRLQQAQRTWARLVSRGITGFVDATGRRWELASYVEMATRSRLADTAVRAHLDRLGDAGLDLVIVSDVAGECRLCRPWEGRVLARSGAGARDVQVEHAKENRVISVHIAGSVTEARSAGLQHPNCRHSLSAYLPGVTTAPTRTADPAGDEARQRQRAIERQIRAWKLRADSALEPAAEQAARARVRAWQAMQRQHLAAHPDLRRKPQRERIGVAR